jgi:Tfp pilus assembly pilus retraction ATPase PilT
MAQALEKLSPQDFEQLIFSLLHREGYMNCTWQGREEDDERDIIGYKFTIDGPPELFQKYVVLCKPDKASLSKYSLNKDIQKIREYAPYCLIVAANIEVSDYKKKVIGDLDKEEENQFTVLLWERNDLLELIEKHQDLRLRYFGIEIDDLASFPAMKNIFQRYELSGFSQRLEMLLKQVFERCIHDSIIVTNALLLSSYMVEEEKLIQNIVAGNTTLQKEMQEFLEEIVSDQTKINFSTDGIRLSGAFVKGLILANKIAEVLQRPSIDEKVLLYSLFRIPDSDTLSLLTERFSSDAIRSMEGALFGHFDIDEQDSIKRFFMSYSDDADPALCPNSTPTGENLDFNGLDLCLDDKLVEGNTGKDELFVVDVDSDSKKDRERGADGDRPLKGPHEEGSKDTEDRGKRPRIQYIPYRISRRPFTSYNYYYDMALDNWLSKTLSFLLYHYKKFSDIFIFPEKPIQIKSNGRLQEVELDNQGTFFSHFQAEAVACMLLNKASTTGLLKKTSDERSISFVYQMKGHQRFRATIMTNAMGVSIALRKIHPPLWSGENLFSNDSLLSSLLDFTEGLVLVAGKPSSGKTTFMNAMLNAVNQQGHSTVVTLENPIETFHAQTCSSIMQLQKGIHFFDYEKAASSAVKSGADLIVVDELRDESSCRASLDAARSGLLAVATINARSCREAFDRILYLCNAEEDKRLASFLLKTVRRIICLKLAPNAEGQLATSFETIDLAREMETREAGVDAHPRIDDMIDAVFDGRKQNPAGT